MKKGTIFSYILILVLLLFSVAESFAAERHWVGNGTGNGRFWDRTANWSATQGGAGGAGVPTAADDVFIDGGGNCQVNTAAVCLSFNQSVSTGSRDFAQNATLTIGAGGLSLSGGLLITNSSSNIITVAGDWIQTGGTFTADGGSIVFNGTSTQTIATLATFNNVTISNSNGIILNSDLTTTGVLSLTDGIFTTGSSSLIISPTGSVTRTNGHVNGNMTKSVATGATSLTYEIGGSTNYSPVDVSFGNVTTPGTLTVEALDGEHFEINTSPIDNAKSVNRYWSFTSSSVVFNNYSATFHFDPSDIDGGANTNNFIVSKFDLSSWSIPTVGTRTATSTQATGLTSFSDFAVGESKTITIMATAGANGSISPSGAVTVTYDGSQSFTITPDVGYHVADVLVDGVSVGAVTSYDFNNVLFDHTIDASFAINVYTITATAGVNGTISPSGAVSVNHGSDQGFTITPDAGYHVADVLVDGVSIGAVTSHTITNVTADHTIDASFAINTYTITATAGANGTISPSGAVSVNHGSDQGFTITPDAGYHVADVLVDGISIGAVTSHTITNVTADHTIDASFAINTYTVTATAGSNGTISPSGAVSVNHGSDQSFTITPDVGYFIADVFVDSVSVGPVASHTFTNVTENHTIEATFAIITYTITATAGANGTISPSGAVSVNHGSDQGFAITPDVGYHVADVLVDGVSIGTVTSHTITNVTADRTIDASFAINTYTITATAGANGTISPSGTTLLTHGSSQSYTITPDVGYFISDVHVDSVSVGAVSSYDFNSVDQNHTIEAYFSIQTFKVTSSAGSGGTISPLGSTVVNYNDSLAFTITPDVGHFIADVHVDTFSAGQVSGYTFYNIKENHNISATFGTFTYKITSIAGANGTISPSGSTVVNSDDSLNFTITPDGGYFIADVFVDTVSVGPVASYTFYNIQGNHIITAAFAQSNTLPSAPTLIAPLNGDTIYVDLVGPSIDFIWHRSVDPDVLDNITYCINLNGASLDTTLLGLSDTTMTWSIVNLLQIGQTYMWTVKATDGHGNVASPDTFWFYVDQAVAVNDLGNSIPKVFALHQNYPNPFNPSTVVQFDLPRSATVTLSVYNILGQEVATLINKQSMDAGYKKFTFDASTVPSGVYLYRIYAEETGDNVFVSVKKMILVK